MFKVDSTIQKLNEYVSLNNTIYEYSGFLLCPVSDSLVFRTSYNLPISDLMRNKEKMEPLLLCLTETKKLVMNNKLFKYEREMVQEYEQLLQQNKQQYDGLSQL